jgi:hypothetical protein
MDMKKLIFAVTILAAASSCQKNWTCTCTASGVATPYVYSINHLTKSQAKTDCNNFVNTVNDLNGDSAKVSCSI